MNNRIKIFQKLFRIEFLALILSLIAIWATYQQNITNRKFYELSVKPLIKHGFTISPNKVGLTVWNYGLGVAIVDSINLNYKGNKVSPKDMIKVLEESYLTDVNDKNITETGISGSWSNSKDVVIKVEDRLELFSISVDYSDGIKYQYDFDKIHVILNQIKVSLFYKDLYGNSKVYRIESTHNKDAVVKKIINSIAN